MSAWCWFQNHAACERETGQTMSLSSPLRDSDPQTVLTEEAAAAAEKGACARLCLGVLTFRFICLFGNDGTEKTDI